MFHEILPGILHFDFCSVFQLILLVHVFFFFFMYFDYLLSCKYGILILHGSCDRVSFTMNVHNYLVIYDGCSAGWAYTSNSFSYLWIDNIISQSINLIKVLLYLEIFHFIMDVNNKYTSELLSMQSLESFSKLKIWQKQWFLCASKVTPPKPWLMEIIYWHHTYENTSTNYP